MLHHYTPIHHEINTSFGHFSLALSQKWSVTFTLEQIADHLIIRLNQTISAWLFFSIFYWIIYTRFYRPHYWLWWALIWNNESVCGMDSRAFYWTLPDDVMENQSFLLNPGTVERVWPHERNYSLISHGNVIWTRVEKFSLVFSLDLRKLFVSEVCTCTFLVHCAILEQL